MDLVFNFREDCFFYLLDFWLILWTSLVLPFLSVLVDLLLHDQYCLSGTASRIFLLKFILFCQLLLFLSFTFLLFLSFCQFQHHFLLFGCRWDLHFIFLIEVLYSIRDLRKLSTFHKLTDPQSAVSQHLLLQWFFPFLIQLLLQIAQCLLILLLVISLELPYTFAVLIHAVEGSGGIIGVLWFLEDAEEGKFFFTDAIDMSAGHESLDGLLDGDDLLPLQVLRVIEFEVFIAGSFFLLVELLYLPLLVVSCLEGAHYTLTTTLDFLDYTDSSLHVSVQSRSFFYDLFFGQIGLLKVYEELIDDLVAFILILIAVIDEVARDVHLDLGGAHAHFKQELIEIDVFGAYGVGVRIVADEVELEFDHSQHGGFEHVLEEHSFLGMDHLVVAIFEDLVAVDVFDVEVGVEAEPLLILSLVLHLNDPTSTPFSPRFSSSG